MRMLTNAVGLAALAGAVGLALAGVSGAEEQGAAKVSIRGTVTKLTVADGAAKGKGVLATVRIEGPPDKTSEHDKAVVKITNTTKLEKQVGGKTVAAKIEDLKEGVKVESMFSGPIMESYPVQSTAGSLVILDDKK